MDRERLRKMTLDDLRKALKDARSAMTAEIDRLQLAEADVQRLAGLIGEYAGMYAAKHVRIAVDSVRQEIGQVGGLLGKLVLDVTPDDVRHLQEIVAVNRQQGASAREPLSTVEGVAVWAMRFGLDHDCESHLAAETSSQGLRLVIAKVPPDQMDKVMADLAGAFGADAQIVQANLGPTRDPGDPTRH